MHACPTQPVLIIDDDPAIRTIITDVLAEEGFATVAAADGAAALTCLKETQPCLILLDLMMPGMDGFAFRAIQRITPQVAAIPVVVLSAFPTSVDTAATLDAVAYLSKPVRLDRLVMVVDRYCVGGS